MARQRHHYSENHLHYLTAHTYQWDAEERVSSVDPGSSPTWSFTYNALGHRAQWVHPGGADQHLFDPEGGWLGVLGSYNVVRFGDRFLVLYTGSDTFFNHVNHLGSTSMFTNHAGTPVEDIVFFPWGDVCLSWGSGGYNFANLPYRDLTTTTDLTTARISSPNFGRWFSPDPDNAGADPSDPQTWNMYAYVRNNPTTLTDPTGERYQVCQTDANGNKTNCADISDAQFDQLGEENKHTLIFTGSGSVLQNGTVIGSYQQTSVDPTPGLIAVGAGTQTAERGIITSAIMIGVFATSYASTYAIPAVITGLTAMGDTGAVGSGAGLLNKINHIFGKAGHNLSGLVQQFGSPAAAYAALEQATIAQIQTS